MEKVLIAGPYADETKRIMTERLSGFEIAFAPVQEAIKDALDADYVIVRTLKLMRETMEQMPNLKFIQRWGSGVDIIDIAYAGSRKIPVANTAGANASSVAELTIGLIFTIYRNMIIVDSAVKRGEWIKDTISKQCSIIDEKTVGIIGFGNIGRLVARYVSAMNGRVQYYDRKDLSQDDAAKAFKPVSLEKLLRTSDIVTLHTPLNESTRHMIDERALGMMKPSAVIINTARGGVVDEVALERALKEGRLRGAGLDCFEEEPVPVDHPLLRFRNVVASCHVGGNTADVQLKHARLCPDNILAFRRNALEEKYIVNRKYL